MIHVFHGMGVYKIKKKNIFRYLQISQHIMVCLKKGHLITSTPFISLQIFVECKIYYMFSYLKLIKIEHNFKYKFYISYKVIIYYIS